MALNFIQPKPMPMHCDNQSTIYIAHNPKRGLSTLRLTIIWSEMLELKRWFLSRLHHPQSNWQIFLPKRLHHEYF